MGLADIDAHAALKLQSHSSSSTTHTSKYGIFSFENEPETQDGADRVTDVRATKQESSRWACLPLYTVNATD